MHQRLKILLSIALGLLLMAIWLYIVDFEEMLGVLSNARIAFILPLIVFFTLMYFIRSLRWKIILSPVENITIIESFNLCMTNYFINFLIPVHAGELVKSMLLKKMKGTPVSKSLLSVYVDKVTDLIPIFLLLIVAPFLSKEISAITYTTSGILVAVLSLCVLFLFFVSQKKRLSLIWIERVFFFLPVRFRMKLRNFLDLFTEGLAAIPQSSGRILSIMGLTVLALIIHCLFLWLFFFSFGITLPVITVLVGYLLLNASFILPAPPGFSGTLELTFLFIFTYLYGYDKNLISAIAASSHVFIAVLFGIFGVVSITLIGTKLSAILKIGS